MFDLLPPHPHDKPRQKAKKPTKQAPLKSFLDTSAQLDQNTKQAFPKKNLEKRARAKYITNTVAAPLSLLHSPLQKSYGTTLVCSATLTEAQGKITGMYCNQRWCLVCARIRTSKLIAGYHPALTEIEDKYFVTLTTGPRCTAKQLPGLIRSMLHAATLIRRSITRTHEIKYSGLRKIECTYDATEGTYHPHFHFIVEGEYVAQLYIGMWLKRFPNAKRSGQDMKQADDNSVMELFKYFTKVVSKTKAGEYKIYLKALDTMFLAMRKVRTFQPFGLIKEVSEDVEPEQAELTHRDITACWSWLETDWLDKETGEILTGFEPSENMQKIASNVVADNKDIGKFASLPSTNTF
jgi:hypothetical protein